MLHHLHHQMQFQFLIKIFSLFFLKCKIIVDKFFCVRKFKKNNVFSWLVFFNGNIVPEGE